MPRWFCFSGLLFLLGSCCFGVSDCDPAYDSFAFCLTDINNEDLLSGPFKKYELQEVRVFTIRKDGSKLYSEKFVPIETDPCTRVEIILDEFKERWFLELNGIVTDTLDISWEKKDSHCCGVSGKILELRLNNSVIQTIKEFTIVDG